MTQTQSDFSAPLHIDWRWTTPNTSDDGASAANARGFEAIGDAFARNPIILSIDRPLDLDHAAVLDLLAKLADFKRATLVLPTLLDTPLNHFLRQAPMLGERVQVTVYYDALTGNWEDKKARLLALREAGIEAAIRWSPSADQIPVVPDHVERLAKLGFPVCMLPSQRKLWDRPVGPKTQMMLLRYATPHAVRWLFAKPDVYGLSCRVGHDLVTIQPDGSVFTSPDDVTLKLGNIFDGTAHLLDGPTRLREARLRSITMLSMLDEAELPPLLGNPISAFLREGTVQADGKRVHYPLRHVDWENPTARELYGLAPLESPHQAGAQGLMTRGVEALWARLKGRI